MLKAEGARPFAKACYEPRHEAPLGIASTAFARGLLNGNHRLSNLRIDDVLAVHQQSDRQKYIHLRSAQFTEVVKTVSEFLCERASYALVLVEPIGLREIACVALQH